MSKLYLSELWMAWINVSLLFFLCTVSHQKTHCSKYISKQMYVAKEIVCVWLRYCQKVVRSGECMEGLGKGLGFNWIFQGAATAGGFAEAAYNHIILPIQIWGKPDNLIVLLETVINNLKPGRKYHNYGNFNQEFKRVCAEVEERDWWNGDERIICNLMGDYTNTIICEIRWE